MANPNREVLNRLRERYDYYLAKHQADPEKAFAALLDDLDTRADDATTVVATFDDVHVYPTFSGEIAFDACASAQEHLLARTPEGEERRVCRTLLEDLVPQAWYGKRGRVVLYMHFEEASS